MTRCHITSVMKLTCCVAGGPKIVIDCEETDSVEDIKSRLTPLLDTPTKTMTVLHRGKELSDSTPISSLDFSKREFVAVVLQTRQPRNIKVSDASTANAPANSSLRRFVYANPELSVTLIAAMAQVQGNRHIFAQHPGLFERLFGISVDEFEIMARRVIGRQTQDDPDTLMSQFFETLSMEDFTSLERIISATNATLETAITALMRHGRNVDEAIHHLNRQE